MKRGLKIVLAVSALSLALGGCVFGGGTEAEGEEGSQGIVVRVVDSAGVAFGADSVYWSYLADGQHAVHKSTHGSDTTMKGARRLNAAGTVWAIEYEGLHGAVFIRGVYSRPESGDPSLCLQYAYTVLDTSAAVLPMAVDLTLKPLWMCE